MPPVRKGHNPAWMDSGTTTVKVWPCAGMAEATLVVEDCEMVLGGSHFELDVEGITGFLNGRTGTFHDVHTCWHGRWLPTLRECK